MSLVVVTGAAGGIGAAVVQQLLRDGYRVLAVDRDVPDAVPWGRDPAVRALKADVACEQDVRGLAERLRELGEPVHGLVGAAGVVHAAPLLETTREQWERCFAVNALGVFLTMQAVAAVMVEQDPVGEGNRRGIVTVSSNAGTTPRAEFGAYGASKAAATSVTHSFGLQLARHGIRANVVCPGTTRTTMVTADWNGEDRSHQPVRGDPETFRLGIPLGRIAEPEDIAEAVCFLVSGRSRHLTLQTLVADGGATF